MVLSKPFDNGFRDLTRLWHLLVFKENVIDQCIYLKVSEGKFIILILNGDDILFANNDIVLLRETKQILSKRFEIKEFNEVPFPLDIEMHRDRCRILGLFEKAYVDRVRKRHNMYSCSLKDAPTVKGDKLSK